MTFDDEFLSSLAKGHWRGDFPLYQFHNCWMRPQEIQGTQNFIKHFEPLPNDIILASFPKTGTTWLKSLLYSITNRSSKHSLTSTHPHQLVPSLEIRLYQTPQPCLPLPQDNASPRIFSTHLTYQLLSKTPVHSSENRIVYVTRNPKDTLISFWHFMQKAEESYAGSWPLEVAVDDFCKGHVPYGPFYDHVLGYRKESLERPQKVLLVTYEELKSDTKNQVKRLGEFLGCPFDNEEEVEEIVKSCDIETLKVHEVNKSDDRLSWFKWPSNSFFRKGEVGDHKNYLSPEMIQRFDDVTREKFHSSGFKYGI